MSSLAGMLRRHPAWADVADTTLRQLVASARPIELAPGQVAVRDGEAASAIHYLVEGLVRVYFPRTRQRPSFTLALLAAPATFGDIACLTGSPYTAAVEALAPARTVAVATPAVLAALAAEPRACLRHYVALAHRFAVATQVERSSVAPRPAERIAALLLAYGQKLGRPVPEGTLIDRAIPQEEIAEQTASNRRSVVRALSVFFRARALMRQGRKLVIVDGDALARAAIAQPG